MPAPIVHGLASIPELWGHHVLGEIDRSLGRLELFAVVHDDAGLGEPGTELVGVLVGDGCQRGRPPAHTAVGSRPRDCGTTEHEREAGSHVGDAIVFAPPASLAAVPFPGGRIR